MCPKRGESTKMTDLQTFDNQEATERLLALYVTPDVVAQRERFLHILAPQLGERVLDVGSGPGFLVSAIAESVGASGSVCGIDTSEPLLAVARSHCARLSRVEFRCADAIRLPFGDDDFDAVASTQVLEYVRDVDAALAEIYRVVRRGGRVAILDTDWDSVVWHSTDRDRMGRILAAWEAHAADSFLPRTLANKLRRHGFHVEAQQVIPMLNTDYDTNTYSNRLVDIIVPFVAGRNGITRDDAEMWAKELRQGGEQGDYFFSLNRYAFLAKKP
jgi:arsenite methyltransferase